MVHSWPDLWGCWPRWAWCGLPHHGRHPGDLLHLRRPHLRRLLRRPGGQVPAVPRLSPGDLWQILIPIKGEFAIIISQLWNGKYVPFDRLTFQCIEEKFSQHWSRAKECSPSFRYLTIEFPGPTDQRFLCLFSFCKIMKRVYILSAEHKKFRFVLACRDHSKRARLFESVTNYVRMFTISGSHWPIQPLPCILPLSQRNHFQPRTL